MSEASVEVRVEWSVLPPQVDAVGGVLHALLSATRGEPGCRTCTLATDMGTLVTLRLREVWDSEDALRQHLRSPRFEALASLLESAITQPRVEFVLPTGTRGFEYARGVRDAIEGTR
ncbi:Antibiotic biosynthesis monooxygenase [Luteitalea pratensis]|uniref:Antibiotic biosynthesis monooxygenase n=1 Tax=Luteitalea pratensis TaxID=1855912 RepID=A0A143PMJ6_LUTPR|nr:antibiotic biosynthesis monooxygenase [Luteitalea pratensis]AMY08994.1 Antibiotic biosynthesis monooxygenase [Luteitalea pratensis]